MSDFGSSSDVLTERRSAVRTSTVFRPVLIETDGFAGFCLVRNPSETGMMGHIYTRFDENQAVTLHFDAELAGEGTLQWCREGSVGVRFDHPLDVDAVLAQLARKVVRGKISRAPRLRLLHRARGCGVCRDRWTGASQGSRALDSRRYCWPEFHSTIVLRGTRPVGRGAAGP